MADLKCWGPDDLNKIGECHVTAMSDPYDPLGRHILRIDWADPVILILDEFVDLIAKGRSPHAKLDDGVLTITGVNRTVVYVVGEHLPEQGAYVCRWPD